MDGGIGWALLHEAAQSRWLRFPSPRRVVVARSVGEVAASLCAVDAAVAHEDLWAVGFVAYEAAPGLDPALRTREPDGFPLVWFGLCEPPEVAAAPPLDPSPTAPLSAVWQPTLSEAAYLQAIDHIRGLIRAGDTYQVNFTYRLRQGFQGSPPALFARLCRAQRPRYAAYLDLGDWVVCSASPELFFRQEGDRVECRPMKGTAARGLTLADDKTQAEDLRASAKNRAENLMIVDMLRNDLGRIAEVGSVQVPELFVLEKYPTLWQLTSVVRARTGAPPLAVLAALFPAASVTGAPKPRTMAVIRELETTPRGLYTGAVGFLGPGRQAQFNVAIRTAVIDRRGGQVEYGTGGGVVWDSEAHSELEETRTKARILGDRAPPEFSLLETMRWTPAEGYFLLPRHLNRLRDSAAYFDFRLDLDEIERRLAALARGLEPGPTKVRLLLDRSGGLILEAAPLPMLRPGVLRVALAARPVRSDDPFLFHKTTHRRVYEEARAEAADLDDVLLFNERGQVTESSVANVIVEVDGELCTPPLACGLLAGTYRAELLELGMIRERPVTTEELLRSPRLWLANSVRGILAAVLAGGARK